uniref:Uncharacterized protein n=1 Tax=Alexandrium catenella TaxID=2925 RepID=A0A7S1LGW3_ALECA
MVKPDLLRLLSNGGADEDQLLACLEEDDEGRHPLDDEADAVAHKRDNSGWTPLHWAAQDGYERLASRLIDLEVGVNTADDCGATPLMVASFNGHRAIVEALLEERTVDFLKTNNFLSSAVHYAAQSGHAGVIQLLGAKRAEIDGMDRHCDTPLSWAARNGHLDAVKKLLELGADPLNDNKASDDPIELAKAAGHLEVAETMEAAVGDPELLAMST